MLRKILKLDIYPYLLILLCLFHLASNIIWINLNKVPLDWDQSGHTIIAFDFTDFFRGVTKADFLSISDYYPPFVHLLVTFFMVIFGKSLLLGPLVVTGFFLLATIFLYFYTYELFKSKLAALYAAFLFSFLPNMYALSREFLLEIPLLSMVLGSLYFLEKSEHFKNRKYTLFFAIFMALALAIKWTAIIYLFIPILIKLFKTLPNIPWKNLFMSLGIVLFINLPWYLHNLPIILNAARFTATPEAADPQKIFSIDSFKFYPFMMTNFQLTWFGMVAFIFSVIHFFRKRNYLLPMLFGVYLMLTFIGNKDLRYGVFLAPIAVMIIAYFLAKLRRNLAVLILTVALFSYFSFYFFNLSFGWPINPTKVDFRKSVQIPAFGWIDLVNLGKDTSKYLAPTFNGEVWPNPTIAKELSGHNPKKDVKILIVCEKPYFNQVNMELTGKQLSLNKIAFFAPYELPPFKNREDLEVYLGKFDVVMVADKDLGFGGGVRYFAVLNQIAAYLKGSDNNFTKINQYFLPDGDTLGVYKPKQDPI